MLGGKVDPTVYAIDTRMIPKLVTEHVTANKLGT